MTGVRLSLFVRANPPADLETVDVGQIDVEHDEVDGFLCRQLRSLSFPWLPRRHESRPL